MLQSSIKNRSKNISKIYFINCLYYFKRIFLPVHFGGILVDQNELPSDPRVHLHQLFGSIDKGFHFAFGGHVTTLIFEMTNVKVRQRIEMRYENWNCKIDWTLKNTEFIFNESYYNHLLIITVTSGWGSEA